MAAAWQDQGRKEGGARGAPKTVAGTANSRGWWKRILFKALTQDFALLEHHLCGEFAAFDNSGVPRRKPPCPVLREHAPYSALLTPTPLVWCGGCLQCMGAGLVGMGIYGTQSVFAEMFGSGPGLGVIAMGFACVLTALCGHFGERRDNKCLLLIYFLVLFGALCTLVAMGSLVLFDQATINAKFSGWWDEFPAQAEQGQAEFNCCGYADPQDRPVGESPPPRRAPPRRADAPRATGGCEVEADADTPGCKQIGLDYMNARFVPLFFLAFFSGLAMVSCRCAAWRAGRVADTLWTRAVHGAVRLRVPAVPQHHEERQRDACPGRRRA